MAIEYKVEEWARLVLAGQQPENIPEDFQISHHDEDPRANSNRIVLTAKTEKQDLAGPRAFPVTLTIELLMTKRDAALVETISQAIRAAFAEPYSALAVNTAADFFSVLDIVSQSADDAEAAKNTRKRVRTLEILAKEID